MALPAMLGPHASVLGLLQWPAMAVTIIGTWFLASTHKTKRRWGFWASLAGNALWMVWGFHDAAYAVIFLQVCLAALNIRGIWKAQPGQS